MWTSPCSAVVTAPGSGKMATAHHCILLLFLSALLTYATAGRLFMDHEPTEHIKTHLSSAVAEGEEIGPWKVFVTTKETEMKKVVSAVKKNVKTHLKGKDVSVLFSKGDKTLVERLARGVMLNTSITLPPPTVLSLIGITLPILLEDYKKDILTKPIGEVLRGDDVKHPFVKGYESLSLFDVLTKLPKTDGKILRDSTLFEALDRRGDLALYYVNAVLGPTMREAWVDAAFSVGMEMTRLNKEATKLTTTLAELQQYMLMLDHEIGVLNEVSKSELHPLDEERFLFHWWLNCPKDSACLFPRLPRDAIINFSPSLRMYLLPSLDLSLIIIGSSTTERPPTLENVIRQDKQLWNQIYSVIDPTAVDSDEEEAALEGTEETSMLMGLLSTWWFYAGFLLFLLSTQVWLYALCRALRFIATIFSSKTHLPRPKTAKQD